MVESPRTHGVSVCRARAILQWRKELCWTGWHIYSFHPTALTSSQPPEASNRATAGPHGTCCLFRGQLQHVELQGDAPDPQQEPGVTALTLHPTGIQGSHIQLPDPQNPIILLTGPLSPWGTPSSDKTPGGGHRGGSQATAEPWGAIYVSPWWAGAPGCPGMTFQEKPRTGRDEKKRHQPQGGWRGSSIPLRYTVAAGQAESWIWWPRRGFAPWGRGWLWKSWVVM